jgi:uncharacterized protein YcaQ
MMKETRVISRTLARRMAIVAQGLAGSRPRADTEGIMDVIGRLGCLQLDPITIVARSHLLVLWSRLGSYDQGLLDLLLWQERRLFEYWAHAASIVLTQDYPIHQMRMRSYGKGSDAWSQQVSAWMQQNETLRISILSALQQRGPLRSLGVATPRDITEHFTRNRYPGLSEVLSELEANERILRVRVQEQGKELVGLWFVHADLLPVLERLEQQAWEPRTTLLSPFDNLICDRKRTARLFDFRYQSEIYTPKDKRRFGYYVMPILSGDQLIGRIDPTFDRSRKQLLINAVHIEPATAITAETGQALAEAIEELAAFLGATMISYNHQLPEGWKQILG